MFKDEKNNLKGLFANDRSRNMIIFTAVLLSISVGVGVFVMGKEKKESADTQAQASIAGAPDMAVMPGTSQSEAYKKLQMESNAAAAQAALESGTSSVPVIVTTTASEINPFDLAEKEYGRLGGTAQMVAYTPPVVANNVEGGYSQQTIDPVDYSNYKESMSASIGALMEQWKPESATVEFNYFGQKNPPPTESQQVAQQSSSAQEAGSQPTSQGETKGKKIIRASKIDFAVMLTSVNSDEPGPILAQITSGPMKGARIMGAFQNQGSKLLLQFNIAAPYNQKSDNLPINAIAIDPATARTALADNVDNHYLSKYGLLFATTFITGFSEAIETSGATVTTAADGGTIQSNPVLSAKEKATLGLGAVGKAFSTELAKGIDRPATVTINSGTAFGLLFMDDVYEK